MLTKLGRLARINVRGVVQGVGFRPFIYRLASKHELKGRVRNTSGSVEIEAEGDEARLNRFIDEIETKAPPMARIESVAVGFASPKGYSDFSIAGSLSRQGHYQLVSPDIATCPDCKREIFAAADRRYRYAFTNCTNCGPRFTIIEDIPYDRPKTTMRAFEMCPLCQREYDNPLDRRFHAQPNACPVCGPKLELVDNDGRAVDCEDVIQAAARLLKEGKILAVKGLGGFQLACDATDEGIVNLLRQRKHRPSKPFAVMMAAVDEVEKHCHVSAEERALLESPQAPIVLLRWQEGSDIAGAVAPELKYLGVMLPYTPLHHLLMHEVGLPLVMTSGNLSEEPIAKDNDEALRRLNNIADYFIMHNRGIYARYDDSVTMVEGGAPQLLRRARGYAPYPVFLPFKAGQILACGAEDKNTFCLTRNEHAFLSQHIGDMENEETLEHFADTIGLYKKLFRVKPEIIAHDMHPEYLATKYALELGADSGLPLVPVQHHHAHIASCMVENGIEEPVIGVAFDGTGYGADGTIWGGEFLVADYKGFQRVGHFDNVPLPGGAAAIKKPNRMALSYLYTLLGEDFDLSGLPLATVDAAEVDIIKQQLKKKINSPLTSSAGRLFDAVSALAGVRGEINYEAQAAIELEMLAADAPDNTDAYPFVINSENGLGIIRLGELWSSLVSDVKNKVSNSLVSRRLHNTIARITADMCRSVSQDTGLRRVALSGGVFQNRLLLRLTTAALKNEGFEVITHRLVPPNDGGVSLGQAVIAHFNNGEVRQ
ncbi:MAG: carbamoyltransferase HypF [Dehalococcoidia bacterium]|jgi:hydrogenase maturation protein HypF